MFKMKPITALVLALLMVVPMLLVVMPAATVKAQTTAPELSVVLDNNGVATTQSNISPMAIGSTFTVDIYLSNTANVPSPGINAISVQLNWNPAVLTCTNMNDGTYLGSKQQGLGDLGPNSGWLQFGLIEVDTANPNEAAAPGTVGIIGSATFQVVGTGTSALSLSPTGSGIAYLDYPVNGKSTAIVGTTTASATYNPVTAISLYQTGTTNNNIQLSGNSYGQTFGVDIYINNPLAVNIWAWNLGVTWNPAALQLTNIVEGTYLNSTGNTFFVPGYVDNNHGDIPQGISDVYLSDHTTNAAEGVLATLYFTVINYQNSDINLTQGIPSLLTLNSSNQPVAVTPAPVLNNATYTTTAPPAATLPQAVITQDTTPTGGLYYAGAQIQFDGLQSTGGVDVIPYPGSPNYPITSYAWTISPSISGVTLTGNTLSFTAPTVASETTYTLTLTVTTAPDTADPNYVNTATATTTFTVQAPMISPNNAGTVVDCFITQLTPTNTTVLQKGAWGYGPNAYADAFGPQEWMNLTAYVTYNGGSVADKPVTFVVKDGNGNIIATIPVTTDSLGYASYLYQLPWYTSNSQNVGEFGVWTVSAETQVGAQVVYDTMPFEYNYIVTVTSVTATPTVARTPIAAGASSSVPTQQTITVDLSNVGVLSQKVYVTYTILDNQSVPIATGYSQATVNAATYTSGAPGTDSLSIIAGTGSVTFTPTIPNYAFVGTAKVIVQVYTANPQSAGNYAATFGQPAQTAGFTIAQETGSQPTPSNGSQTA